MHRHVTRICIVMLGAFALSAGAFVLMESQKAVSGPNIGLEDPFLKTFLHIRHEAKAFTSQDDQCVCSQREKTQSPPASEKSQADKTQCAEPSLAERMGIAVRSVSL